MVIPATGSPLEAFNFMTKISTICSPTLNQSKKTTRRIRRLVNAQIPAKRSLLDADLDQVAEGIKTKFALSFSKLLDAATQMAFCPHPCMAAIQGASLLHAGADDTTDSGVTIPREYLVDKVYELKADLMDWMKLSRQWQANHNCD